MSLLPVVGSPFPQANVLLSSAEGRGHTALLFLGSGCPTCKTLAKDLSAVMRDPEQAKVLADDEELVIVTDDKGSEVFAGRWRVVEKDREFRHQVGVVATPAGFGVDREGVVRAAGFLSGVDDVRGLLERCREAAATLEQSRA